VLVNDFEEREWLSLQSEEVHQIFAEEITHVIGESKSSWEFQHQTDKRFKVTFFPFEFYFLNCSFFNKYIIGDTLGLFCSWGRHIASISTAPAAHGTVA